MARQSEKEDSFAGLEDIMSKLIGKRKFILCIFTILVYAVMIYILALTDSDISLLYWYML